MMYCVLLFADDITICKEVQNINDCFVLQDSLNELSEWCTLNKLYFNISKRLVMLMQPKY